MTTAHIAEEQSLLHRLEQVQPNLTAVRSELMGLEQQARTLIRQRPVVALLAAAGAGYFVARLVARGMR